MCNYKTRRESMNGLPIPNEAIEFKNRLVEVRDFRKIY